MVPAGGRPSKRQAFRRVAERRTNAVLEKIRILGNCANTYAYEWCAQDVEAIFDAIARELTRTKLRFEPREHLGGPFRLNANGLEVERASRALGMNDAQSSPPSPDEPDRRLAPCPPATADSAMAGTPSGDDFEVRGVPGHVKSQVLVSLPKSSRHVLVKDRGHKRGHQLLLFDPYFGESTPAQVVYTPPGALRRDAIAAAKQLLLEALEPSGA